MISSVPSIKEVLPLDMPLPFLPISPFIFLIETVTVEGLMCAHPLSVSLSYSSHMVLCNICVVVALCIKKATAKLMFVNV